MKQYNYQCVLIEEGMHEHCSSAKDLESVIAEIAAKLHKKRNINPYNGDMFEIDLYSEDEELVTEAEVYVQTREPVFHVRLRG